MSDDHGTFSIRVVDGDGDPVTSASVCCSYGIMSGAQTEYTDSDGWTHFPIIMEIMRRGVPIKITQITVNGDVVRDDDFYPEDGDTFSFVQP